MPRLSRKRLQRRLRRVEKFLGDRELTPAFEHWMALRGEEWAGGYVGKLEQVAVAAKRLVRAIDCPPLGDFIDGRDESEVEQRTRVLRAALEEVRWHGWVGRRTKKSRPPLTLLLTKRPR